jgi:hypothetical protein
MGAWRSRRYLSWAERALQRAQQVGQQVGLADQRRRAVALGQVVAVVAAQEQEWDAAVGQRVGHRHGTVAVQVEVEDRDVGAGFADRRHAGGDRAGQRQDRAAVRLQHRFEIKGQQRFVLDYQYAHLVETIIHRALLTFPAGCRADRFPAMSP